MATVRVRTAWISSTEQTPTIGFALSPDVRENGADVGLAVVIGARVWARAGPSEILTTSTVTELVAGSGLVLENAGKHHLKGVPEARTSIPCPRGRWLIDRGPLRRIRRT